MLAVARIDTNKNWQNGVLWGVSEIALRRATHNEVLEVMVRQCNQYSKKCVRKQEAAWLKSNAQIFCNELIIHCSLYIVVCVICGGPAQPAHNAHNLRVGINLRPEALLPLYRTS